VSHVVSWALREMRLEEISPVSICFFVRKICLIFGGFLKIKRFWKSSGNVCFNGLLADVDLCRVCRDVPCKIRWGKKGLDFYVLDYYFIFERLKIPKIEQKHVFERALSG